MSLNQNIIEEMTRVINGFREDLIDWNLRNDQGVVDMIQSDIDYNQQTLDEFVVDGDLEKLVDRIYDQDTAPREDFYRVFNMIQDEVE